MSNAHIDWHESPLSGLQVCTILDYSSRMIVPGGEYVHCNTENSIKVINELVRGYWDICSLRELIMDHGSEFGAHRINEKSKDLAFIRLLISFLKNLCFPERSYF